MVIGSFNPLDRGNSNQIEQVSVIEIMPEYLFQSPRSGKF